MISSSFFLFCHGPWPNTFFFTVNRFVLFCSSEFKKIKKSQIFFVKTSYISHILYIINNLKKNYLNNNEFVEYKKVRALGSQERTVEMR